MADLREAKQKYSDKKLETIVKVLQQLDDEEDDTPLFKLCRKAGLSRSELKLHHRYAEHFYQDWGTYGEAVDSLKKQCIAKVRNAVMEKLKQMKFQGDKDPPLPLILLIAKRTIKVIGWIHILSLRRGRRIYALNSEIQRSIVSK